MSSSARRRERLRESLTDDRVLILTARADIRYLTGFSGSNGVLAIDRDAEILGTDGRYVDQVAAEASDFEPVIDRDTLAAVLARLGSRRLEVDGSMSAAGLVQCQRVDPSTTVVDGRVAALRLVKDADELTAIAVACDITVRALEVLCGELRVGMTELSVARRLEQLFGELGAQDRAFETIVGTGANSAIPHHAPDSTMLTRGDLLVIDCGALVQGYHADMTRTFVVGAEPSSWQAELHHAVLEAQSVGRAALRPGAGARDVDATARRCLEDVGLGERFTHGLGHGVGLQIHEPPFLGPRATGSITAGMAITVEPGAYLPGRGGVRIEDTLAVTDVGSRVLTEAARSLRVVAA